MDEQFYQNKLCDVIERLAVNLRVDFETYKAEKRSDIKDLSDKIALQDTRIALLEKALETQKENQVEHEKPSEQTGIIKQMLTIIGAIVGLLALGLAFLKEHLK